MKTTVAGSLLLGLLVSGCAGPRSAASADRSFDLVIVGGTPGGIMAAVASAREGKTAVLLDRNVHIGGLPANGLGATDIHTRGATGGLFLEFVGRVKAHYVAAYGAGSPQVRDCSDGYHFEPSVGEKVLEQMLAEHPSIAVRRERQFDARPENVRKSGARVTGVTVTHRRTGAVEFYAGRVFIDATYEGDLAAAAGAPFRTRREGKAELHEPLAGRVYKHWGGSVGEGSTYEGDDSLQAYNYRLCLTDRPDNLVPVPKPDTYDRAEYASVVDDVRLDRTAGKFVAEKEWAGIGKVVNIVTLPNSKTDANNQHLAFLSTDLPEENWPWPTADWAWRDRFAQRLRDYTLGLLWFVQHDPALPEEFRRECLKWGLAKDEYQDNGHFPRQAYVREGRRIEGDHLFTAHDAIPEKEGGRPPVHRTSITASHYAIDSHAVRKREPGRIHLDGFLSYRTQPYTVPYGVIVPKNVDGLLAPVAVSASHLGFGTLRMEPCWMALGQAAGIAASLALEDGDVRKVNLDAFQDRLLAQKAILIYYKDVPPHHPAFEQVQRAGLRGLLPHWEARLDEPISQEEAARLGDAFRTQPPRPGTPRGEALKSLSRKGP